MGILKIAKIFFSTTRKKLNINDRNFSFAEFFAQFFQIFDRCIKVWYDDHSTP